MMPDAPHFFVINFFVKTASLYNPNPFFLARTPSTQRFSSVSLGYRADSDWASFQKRASVPAPSSTRNRLTAFLRQKNDDKKMMPDAPHFFVINLFVKTSSPYNPNPFFLARTPSTQRFSSVSFGVQGRQRLGQFPEAGVGAGAVFDQDPFDRFLGQKN